MSGRRGGAALLLLLLLLLSAVGPAGCRTVPVAARLQPAQPLVFVDVTVVDGTGAPPLAHRDVVVDGDRIVAVTPTGDGARPAGARVLDGRGRTLLPGFVDAHTHLASSGGPPWGPGLLPAESLERFLWAGVTTVFDLGSAADEVAGLARASAAGALAAPRILHTHRMITGRDSHPIPLGDTVLPFGSALVGLAVPQIDDDDDIGPALDAVVAAGARYVKVIVDRMPRGHPVLDRALLAALVAAARARGLPVLVHAGDVDDAVAAAEAGATALAHLPWRGTLDVPRARRLKDSGVVVISTVFVWERTAALLTGRMVPTDVDRAVVPEAMVQAAGQPPDHPRLQELAAELGEHTGARGASLRALLAAGVPVVVGTDAVLPGVWPGAAYVAERRALLAAGMTVDALIPAMTSAPARMVAGPDADFGVVAAGKAADLVLVDGDPLQDPAALDRIAVVVRGGRVVERLLSWPATHATRATRDPATTP